MRVRQVVCFIVLALGIPRSLWAADEAQRLESVRKLYEQQKWEEVVREAHGPAEQSAEFDYYEGMALSRLGRWNEARRAFSNGARKTPRDARFLTERAGAEYKLNDFAGGKGDLRKALRLEPRDTYASEFLGTIYLLEGNVEAVLKYWNRIEKPRLAAVELTPPPKTRKNLLDGAISFSPPGVLGRDSFLKTNALLENLEVFGRWRTELTPDAASSSTSGSDDYKAMMHLNERNALGSSIPDSAISLLRGLPYETIYPAYFNMRGQAVNFDSLLRWDSEKRRVDASFSFPLFSEPAKRLRLFFDARNENWNLSRTFAGGAVSITDLNLKRFSGGAQLHLVENGRTDVTVGLEAISRVFKNALTSLSSFAAPLFRDGRTADAWLGAHRSLIRVPERRFTVDGKAEVRAGRNYASGLGAFGGVKGELKSRWLPKARGDDYEFESSLRGGQIFGDVPLDELYQLGVERDNDLWLRGHSGTTDGRKGRAPLGRRYLLLNSEFDKTAYDGAFFQVQLGPFFDSGAIADPSEQLGSKKWLFDTGVQAKIRVLGSVSVVLSYGRDLRNGTGVFYGTSVQ